jgi:TonB family protein
VKARIPTVCLLIATFACSISPLALATVTDADLQKEYGDKVLTLRQFYPGAHLRFDSSGKCLGSAVPGSWTTDGMLRVEKISFTDRSLHIRGQRLFLEYDPATKKMRVRNHSKVLIEIEPGQAQPERADLAKIMSLVFLSPEEKLVDAVPDYWSYWLKHGQDTKPDPTALPESPQKVGNGISPPHAVHTPDPDYSEAAKQSHYQGTVVLWMVVGSDGAVCDIRIVRALGLGLDEQAVKAVQTWKFRPALKDGKPVDVQINVEVNFRLY